MDNAQTFEFLSTKGKPFSITLPKPAERDSFFILSLPKAGSTLLNKIFFDVCDLTMIPNVGLFPEIHNNGIAPSELNPDINIIWKQTGYAYTGFRSLPKAMSFDFKKTKNILLIRDPRDMLVSLYFSLKYSHPVPKNADENHPIVVRRKMIEKKGVEEVVRESAPNIQGIFYSYSHLPEETTKVYRYEDIIFNKTEWISDMLDFLEISLPSKKIKEIADKHDIVPTNEDHTKHIRQVKPGNHKKHLSPLLISQLNEMFKPIMDQYGYHTECSVDTRIETFNDNLILNTDDEEHFSCSEIERGLLVFFPNNLMPCCRMGRNTHMSGYDEFDIEKYNDLAHRITQKNKELAPAECRSCNLYVKQHWPRKNENYIINNIIFNHYVSCKSNCIDCILNPEQMIAKNDPTFIPKRVVPLLSQLIDNGYLNPQAIVSWGGGEPALLPEFDAILRLLSEYGCSHIVNTSGIKKKKSIAVLLGNGGALQLIFSLDCGTAESYRAIKGVDQFETVVKNLTEYADAAVDRSCIKLKYVVMNSLNVSEEDFNGFLSLVENLRVSAIVDLDGSKKVTMHQVWRLCCLVKKARDKRIVCVIGGAGTNSLFGSKRQQTIERINSELDVIVAGGYENPHHTLVEIWESIHPYLRGNDHTAVSKEKQGGPEKVEGLQTGKSELSPTKIIQPEKTQREHATVRFSRFIYDHMPQLFQRFLRRVKGVLILPAYNKMKRRHIKRVIKKSGLFYYTYYLKNNPDVAKSGMDALVHFIIYGDKKGRAPNPVFDSKWYLDTYSDVADTNLNSLYHYIIIGADEGRNPGPHFSTKDYLHENPVVKEKGMNPLYHYLHYGIVEGRQ